MRRATGINYSAYKQLGEQLERSGAPATDIEITKASQYRDELFGYYENGFSKGLSTGWLAMDPFFTVRHGEFTVITGIPGHGKSSWLDNLLINLARQHDWKFAVFSAENFPVSRYIASLTEVYSGRPFRRGFTERISSIDLDLSLKFLDSHFFFIQPNEDSYSLNRIIELASQIPDIDVLVIDPWNELDHSRPDTMREDQYISITLTKLRWVARSAQIHVFVVAHPAKYLRGPGQAKPVITLNDVKGASEWYAKADNGLSIWRDEQEGNRPTEVHVQKIRFREVGRVGKVDFFYDRVTGIFRDTATPPRVAIVDDEPWQGQF